MNPIDHKSQITDLLKGIETGDPASVSVVNEAQYIQHNPSTKEGNVGLAELFARLAKTNPRVEVIRAFEDNDFVFAHTEYDFSSEKICFEVFRFENGQAVEHWDNLQSKQAPNGSGHDMISGPTEATDLHLTESNRTIARAYVERILIQHQWGQITQFINPSQYTEHHPSGMDGVSHLLQRLQHGQQSQHTTSHEKLHRVLAEGNFVLTVSEGRAHGQWAAFYDLFRIENQHIVEHWDTIELIPPKSQWQNTNGKF